MGASIIHANVHGVKGGIGTMDKFVKAVCEGHTPQGVPLPDGTAKAFDKLVRCLGLHPGEVIELWHQVVAAWEWHNREETG